VCAKKRKPYNLQLAFTKSLWTKRNSETGLALN